MLVLVDVTLDFCVGASFTETKYSVLLSVDVTVDIRVEGSFNESEQLALFEQILELAQQDPDGFIDDYDTLAGSLVLGDSESCIPICAW